MVELQSNTLDRLFYALADSTRRDIVKRLCSDELRIVDLAGEYQSTLMNICKHVRILESAGLVSLHKNGRASWCRLRPEGFKTVRETVQFYEQFWAHQLDGLKKIAELTERTGGEYGNKTRRRNRRKT